MWLECEKNEATIIGVEIDGKQIPADELDSFSLKGRYDYSVPYYNINGNKDYQTNFEMAQEYFDLVNAPKKEIYIMDDTSHGLLESKSSEFSEIIHKIAEKEIIK